MRLQADRAPIGRGARPAMRLRTAPAASPRQALADQNVSRNTSSKRRSFWKTARVYRFGSTVPLV